MNKKQEETEESSLSTLLTISVISINQQRLEKFAERNSHIKIARQSLGDKEENLSESEIDEIATAELANIARKVKGSLGNAHSIMAALKKCISENKHKLILEDDTQLHPEITQFIEKKWEHIKKLDILVLGGNTDSVITFEAMNGMPISGVFTRNEDRYPEYSKISKTFTMTPVMNTKTYKLHKIFGSHAWIVSPAGAKQLIKRCFPLDTNLIDIPLLPHKVLGISFDRRWNATLAEIEAEICLPFLALTPNNAKSRSSE